MMTRTVLFIVTLFALFPVYGQESVWDCQWHYVHEYVVDPERYEIGIRWDYDVDVVQTRAYDDYYIRGTEEINGKTYQKLYVTEAAYGVKAEQGSMSNEDLQETHILYIRKDAGRVYALKDMYVEYVRHYCQDEKIDVYLAEAEDEREILLYDYTLEEGDPYPSMDHPIVVKTDYIKLLLADQRKVLWLSNGCIIVEGIGCVYSLGTLVCYQNLIVSTRQETAKNYMLAFLRNYQDSNGIPLFQWLAYRSVVTGIDSIRKSPKEAVTHQSTFFDLSGRQLPQSSFLNHQSTIKPGIYIHDGKKVVVR